MMIMTYLKKKNVIVYVSSYCIVTFENEPNGNRITIDISKVGVGRRARASTALISVAETSRTFRIFIDHFKSQSDNNIVGWQQEVGCGLRLGTL